MRKCFLLLLSVMTMLALVACGGNKVDDATSKKYIMKAEEIVLLLNEGKYEEVHTMFDDQMKTGLTVEQMGDLTPLIEQSGEYNNIDKSSVEEKDGYYVAVLVAKYSEENRIYTISFNDKEEVAGLYIK